MNSVFVLSARGQNGIWISMDNYMLLRWRGTIFFLFSFRFVLKIISKMGFGRILCWHDEMHMNSEQCKELIKFVARFSLQFIEQWESKW